MKRFRVEIAAVALCATFVASPIGIPAVNAQAVSSESIIESLKPKKPLTRSLTRSFSNGAETQDDKFLNALPTRGIRIEQRKKLDEIVEKQDLPRIDIEINFDYDSAAIRPSSIADVDELGKALTSDVLSESRIVLNGHTDASGSDAYNQGLSDQRAASVREYLIQKHGIDGKRLVAIGYGEERLKNQADPLAAENRRVEVINLTKN